MTIKENMEKDHSRKSSHNYILYVMRIMSDVVGILDTRDYFRLDSIEQDNVINKAMDQPFFISQNMKADVLLKEMKIKKSILCGFT